MTPADWMMLANCIAVLLISARALWLERELARRPPAPVDDGKATRVWKNRKPTVFHLRVKP